LSCAPTASSARHLDRGIIEVRPIQEELPEDRRY
jgi:hypothetical protein